jgi:hypothetical protein
MINYFAKCTRPSPLNFIVVRLLAGVYSIWKLLSYDFYRLELWPDYFFESHSHNVFLFAPNNLAWIEIEVGIMIILMALFMLGYRLGLVCFFAALILTHLTALHYVVTNSASTFLPTIYLLMLWGLFRHEDPYQFGQLKPDLKSSKEYDFSALKWLILIVGATYFFTGYVKFTNAFWAWMGWQNLALLIHREAPMHLETLPPLGQWLLHCPAILRLASVGTLILEVGFLVAILVKRVPLWPFVISIFVFHTVIALSMNIFFFDQYIILALFFPWDHWLAPLFQNKGILT